MSGIPVCARCGRSIVEHHAFHDDAPGTETEGVFSMTTSGLYCPDETRRIDEEYTTCPAMGVYGIHSDGYFDDSSCQWCGERSPHTEES